MNIRHSIDSGNSFSEIYHSPSSHTAADLTNGHEFEDQMGKNVCIIHNWKCILWFTL